MYTVRAIPGDRRTDARSITLTEAFNRIMAFAGYEQWVFTRTARIMQLIMLPGRPDSPSFESDASVDQQARNDIMAQVCAHGLSGFCVALEDQQPTEVEHKRAAIVDRG